MKETNREVLMSGMPYVCLYMSYLEILEPFTDAQRGRLMTAMLRYAVTGEVPQFKGTERYIWPSMQSQLDRDMEAYQQRCAKNKANGAKGGRPSKNRTVSEITEGFSEEPKKPKENEKENDKENDRENEKENEKERERKKERERVYYGMAVSDSLSGYCTPF